MRQPTAGMILRAQGTDAKDKDEGEWWGCKWGPSRVPVESARSSYPRWTELVEPGAPLA